MYFCASVYFKTSKKGFAIDPDIICEEKIPSLSKICNNRNTWCTYTKYKLYYIFRMQTNKELKPVTNEQVFYDKFSYDKFYLPSALVYMQRILYDKFSYDKFYFTGVNVSTSLL